MKENTWENVSLNQDMDDYISALNGFSTENRKMIFWSI
jgi:hypothetical protein